MKDTGRVLQQIQASAFKNEAEFVMEFIVKEQLDYLGWKPQNAAKMLWNVFWCSESQVYLFSNTTFKNFAR